MKTDARVGSFLTRNVRQAGVTKGAEEGDQNRDYERVEGTAMGILLIKKGNDLQGRRETKKHELRKRQKLWANGSDLVAKL